MLTTVIPLLFLRSLKENLGAPNMCVIRQWKPFCRPLLPILFDLISQMGESQGILKKQCLRFAMDLQPWHFPSFSQWRCPDLLCAVLFVNRFSLNGFMIQPSVQIHWNQLWHPWCLHFTLPSAVNIAEVRHIVYHLQHLLFFIFFGRGAYAQKRGGSQKAT